MIPLSIKSLLVSLILIIFLTGCWNRREMNELAIATAMAIDKGSNDQYLVSVQVVNPNVIASTRGGGGGRSPVITYQAEGKTIFESLRKMTAKMSTKIYNSHLRILVIGPQIAKEGISDVLDFLYRDHEFRSDFAILVSKDLKAEKILKYLTPDEEIPAERIFSAQCIRRKRERVGFH